MNNDLQLIDYYDGYIFRFICGVSRCGHQWADLPEKLMECPSIHKNMYLPEVEEHITCPRCRQAKVKITVILQKPHHHFVGGMV